MTPSGSFVFTTSCLRFRQISIRAPSLLLLFTTFPSFSSCLYTFMIKLFILKGFIRREFRPSHPLYTSKWIYSVKRDDFSHLCHFSTFLSCKSNSVEVMMTKHTELDRNDVPTLSENLNSQSYFLFFNRRRRVFGHPWLIAFRIKFSKHIQVIA